VSVIAGGVVPVAAEPAEPKFVPAAVVVGALPEALGSCAEADAAESDASSSSPLQLPQTTKSAIQLIPNTSCRIPAS
jgi:hypothetical protein